MSVRLHIERLVIDPGLGADNVDGQVVREAIQVELGRLLAEAGLGWASADAWRVEAPAFAAPRERGAEALGGRIAGALHDCLRQEQGDRIA